MRQTDGPSSIYSHPEPSRGRKKGVKKPSDEKYTVKPFPQMKLLMMILFLSYFPSTLFHHHHHHHAYVFLSIIIKEYL